MTFSTIKLLLFRYGEVENWDFTTGSAKLDESGSPLMTGHMTQMLWTDSQSVGYGVFKNEAKLMVVARYNPAGNMQGQYAEKVLPPAPQTDPPKEPDDTEPILTGEAADRKYHRFYNR